MNEQAKDSTPPQEVERLIAAAQDALTDEMVTRLASAAGEGIELLDQVHRAGLARAIPALAQLVNNGDLERLVQLSRLYGSAQDALTDEMVGRLADTVGSAFTLLDRFSRGGADRLLQILEHLEASGALERTARALPQVIERLSILEDMLTCVDDAAKESRQAAPSAGGLGGLWGLMKDPENQESLRFLILVGKKLAAACAHRH